MDNAEFRAKVGKLFQSTEFMLACASQGKPEPVTDPAKAALSISPVYAVVEAAEITAIVFNDKSLIGYIQQIAEGYGCTLEIAEKCARLAWQAPQPVIDPERIKRDIMGCTSGNLPTGELKKDTVRVMQKAKLLLEWLDK